jgi:ferredoxin-NADP reductase
MVMPNQRVSLLDRREVARDTISFHFAKPASFHFTAGQFMEIILLDPSTSAPRDGKHHFTISSAPFEKDLVITTRMRPSAFKRALRALPLGAEVEIEPAVGKFILHSDATRPAALLTGGIGVTAARSILVQALHDKLPHQIVHFYADQRPEDAAFLGELQQLASDNPHYTLMPTMTQVGQSEGWAGETGRIDMVLIRRYLDDPTLPIYYASGPPEMVQAMDAMFERAGIDRQNIRTERYTGY